MQSCWVGSGYNVLEFEFQLDCRVHNYILPYVQKRNRLKQNFTCAGISGKQVITITPFGERLKYPRRRRFKFIVSLDVFTSLDFTEVGDIKGLILDNMRVTGLAETH
jgi:hypothetical protein